MRTRIFFSSLFHRSPALPTFLLVADPYELLDEKGTQQSPVWFGTDQKDGVLPFDVQGLAKGITKEFMDHYMKGFQHYLKGQWKEAAESLGSALEIRKHDGPANQLMGYIQSCDLEPPVCQMMKDRAENKGGLHFPDADEDRIKSAGTIGTDEYFVHQMHGY